MPWLEHSAEIIVMFKALGLSKAQISRVLSGDVAKVEGEIIDPDTGTPQLIPASNVYLVKMEGCKTVKIMINELPIKQFFFEYTTARPISRGTQTRTPLLLYLVLRPC